MTKQEKISRINNELTLAIAAEKATRAKADAEYYVRVHQLQQEAQEDRERATDDPDEPQECDQPAQWLDGSQESCVRLARRILKKLPKLNSPKETIHIEISPSYFGGCGLYLRYINIINKEGGVETCELYPKDEPEDQEQKIDIWMKKVEGEMAKAQEIMREEAENE